MRGGRNFRQRRPAGALPIADRSRGFQGIRGATEQNLRAIGLGYFICAIDQKNIDSPVPGGS
jgi:hypothetical protein